MPYVPGLRSPYNKVGRLVYFGRMLDKIRLHAAGQLPADYHTNYGETLFGVFDARCCRFLGVSHHAIADQVREGKADDAILAWCHEQGGARTDEQCEIWNMFMLKRGWRDDRSAVLRQRIVDGGLADKPIETFFDLIDYDEGRDPLATRAWELKPTVILLMGVCGSGKTTIGRKLAAELGWRFADADEFHPPANIAKMASGVSLDDTDRAPWLDAIRDHIARHLRENAPCIVACSALKEKYRQHIARGDPGVILVHLSGEPDQLRERLEGRENHFMKAGLLASQLSTLEPPMDALVINIASNPDDIVARIRNHSGL